MFNVGVELNDLHEDIDNWAVECRVCASIGVCNADNRDDVIGSGATNAIRISDVDRSVSTTVAVPVDMADAEGNFTDPSEAESWVCFLFLSGRNVGCSSLSDYPPDSPCATAGGGTPVLRGNF